MNILKPTMILFAIAALALGVACWLGIRRYHEVQFCKQREVALETKVESIRRAAIQKLKVGTNKEDIVRFFTENQIPLDFEQIGDKSEARGTLFVPGIKECGSFACGTDAALIGVEVEVDDTGNVTSEPQVFAMGTDCL